MRQAKRVLLTGADGMLGAHICRKLLERDYQVRALVEPHRPLRVIAGLAVEIHYGNVCDPDTIARAIEDCDYIIHTAALTQLWPARLARIWQVNYKAVITLAEAALRAPILRLVHISSASSFSWGPAHSPGDEGRKYCGARYRLDYLDSKYKAQQRLLAYHKARQLPVVIINPTFMLGAYDSRPGSGAMVRAVARRKIAGYSQGGKNFVAAHDVATIAVDALQLGQLGECYIVGGRNLSYQRALRLIARCAEVPPPRIPLPNWLVLLGGLFSSCMAILLRRPPALSYRMAQLALEGAYYSSAKAQREFQFTPSNIEQAIQELLQWFKREGYL